MQKFIKTIKLACVRALSRSIAILHTLFVKNQFLYVFSSICASPVWRLHFGRLNFYFY